MQEKEMVNDALNSINSGLTAYASMIVQTENQELRSTLKQMRDQAEKSQFDLYLIAKNLGYYTPAQQAPQDEIMKVKSEVSCSDSDFSQSSSFSSSIGLPKDIELDPQKIKDLQAPPKTQNNSFS